MQREDLEKIGEIEVKKLPKLVKIGIVLIGIALLLWILSLRNILGIEAFKFPYSLALIPVIVITVVLHELAHGVMFKLYTGTMKFGFKLRSGLGMAFYTTCPGYILSKTKMIRVAIAPQVFTIITLVTLAVIQMPNWLAYSLLSFAAFNLAGGCMDLLMVAILLKLKGRIFVEDTGTGATIYRQK